MKSHKTKSRLKILLLVLVILIASVYVGYKLLHEEKADGNTSEIQQGGINYNPPTDEEKQSGDQAKDEVIQKEKDVPTPEPNTTKQKASVIITDAEQYDNTIEVRAFIPDHYQDGTCTITITKDDYRVSKSTPAYRDATTTICTNPLFTRSEFTVSGEWSVVVSYSSTGAQGTSSPQAIDIR